MTDELSVHAGKTALVTGSTSGIGLGIAKALARTGANIVVNGLGSKDDIERAVSEVREQATAEVIFDDADLRMPDAIDRMIGDASDRFGAIDILVNNAGIQHVAPVQEFPVEKWDEIIAINLSSAFHTIRGATSGMLAKGWGRVINIASVHALVASPYKAAYVSAKHGMAGLTRVVALELATHNITVNAICPGYVKTPLVTGQVADTARVRGISEEEVIRDVMLAAQPSKKFVTIDQVANLAVFLCSDAADGINGAMLPVDGGWSAQ